MTVAPSEANCGDEIRQVRGRKFSLLFAKDASVPQVTREVDQSQEIDRRCTRERDAEEASTARRRSQRRRGIDDIDRRAARAEMLVQLGEWSSGRQALEAAETRCACLESASTSS